MINCFSDLEELCWHIKGLWYMARCRHSLWFVRCILLGLHYQVNWKQKTSLKKVVWKKGASGFSPSLSVALITKKWTRRRFSVLLFFLTTKMWRREDGIFSSVFCSLHTFHSGANDYYPSCFAHHVLFCSSHWDSNTWQQGLREPRTMILLVWKEGRASLLLHKYPSNVENGKNLMEVKIVAKLKWFFQWIRRKSDINYWQQYLS